MADNKFIVRTPVEVECYNNGSIKTIIQAKAPSTMMVKVLGWGIFFDGTATTEEPATVTLTRQNSGGTMTSMTCLGIKPIPESIQTSSQYNAVVEPSDGDTIDLIQVHPQSGFEIKFPEGEEIYIPEDGYIGITVTVAAPVNCHAKLICEE